MSGYKIGLYKPSDWFWEKVNYAQRGIEKTWESLGRLAKAEKMPTFYQGDAPLCVVCTMLWVGCWYGKNTVDLMVRFKDMKIDPDGTYPRNVMDFLQKAGLFPYYMYLESRDRDAILTALKQSPLAVGIQRWPFAHGMNHMMALIDVSPENGDYICINWSNQDKLDVVTLPKDTEFSEIIAFSEKRPPFEPIMGLIDRLILKIKSLCLR